jgi:STE24 endopeptidase
VVDFASAYIEEFSLERRFGLSEQPYASWLQDKLKQDAIAAGLAAFLSGALAEAVRRAPKTWPWVASAGVLPLLLIANVVVPLYILPLFNEYTEIEGPLEERLRRLASRYGVGDARILRMNMSKQTKKANAFVTGIFRTHRIVVGDTLIENFTPEEIEFVVAHELGHYVAKDSWRMIAAGQISATIVLLGAARALGESEDKNAAIAPARIQFWASAISQALRPALASFSRSREWAADRFAVEATQTPHAGADAFKRLRDQNLAEDEQPAWYETLFAGHPSLKARIRVLETQPAAD